MTPKDPFLEGTFWDKFWRPIRSRALLFTPEKKHENPRFSFFFLRFFRIGRGFGAYFGAHFGDQRGFVFCMGRRRSQNKGFDGYFRRISKKKPLQDTDNPQGCNSVDLVQIHFGTRGPTWGRKLEFSPHPGDGGQWEKWLENNSEHGISGHFLSHFRGHFLGRHRGSTGGVRTP